MLIRKVTEIIPYSKTRGIWNWSVTLLEASGEDRDGEGEVLIEEERSCRVAAMSMLQCELSASLK